MVTIIKSWRKNRDKKRIEWLNIAIDELQAAIDSGECSDDEIELCEADLKEYKQEKSLLEWGQKKYDN